jgi:hypothetical protein
MLLSVGSGFAIIMRDSFFCDSAPCLHDPPAKKTHPIVALPGLGTKTVMETVMPDGTKNT